MDLATIDGWMVYYLDQPTRMMTSRAGAKFRVPNMNRQGAGFPDLTLLRPPRLVYAELKRDLGPRGGGEDDHVNPTDAQWLWLNTFRKVPGVEAYVWRPSDIDTVMALLR